jgi:hypothetical protein
LEELHAGGVDARATEEAKASRWARERASEHVEEVVVQLQRLKASLGPRLETAPEVLQKFEGCQAKLTKVVQGLQMQLSMDDEVPLNALASSLQDVEYQMAEAMANVRAFVDGALGLERELAAAENHLGL